MVERVFVPLLLVLGAALTADVAIALLAAIDGIASTALLAATAGLAASAALVLLGIVVADVRRGLGGRVVVRRPDAEDDSHAGKDLPDKLGVSKQEG